MDCNICCLTITKTTRRDIKCPYCEFICCLPCFKKYLLDSSNNADCMNCHKELSLDFIAQNTPKSFHNDEYRKKRANDLLSKEKSLLPDTQYLVEIEKKKNTCRETLTLLRDERAQLNNRKRQIEREIFLLEESISNMGESKTQKERKQFIAGCPIENCRGFLSTAYKCGICETYVCPKCHTVKTERNDDGHECNPELVASATLIKKETKPCPKCAVPIFKISGCSQIWCTECYTAFDWNTGVIENKNIHNPHYYEWQRQNNNGVAPRVPGDDPCGYNVVPWIGTVRKALMDRGQNFLYITQCHRSLIHANAVLLPLFPDQIDARLNTDLRVKYLLNAIDEHKWLQKLKERQKKAEKDHDIHQVIDMYIVTLRDILNTFVAGQLTNLEETANELRSYVDNQLHNIEKKYSNIAPRLTEDWIWV